MIQVIINVRAINSRKKKNIDVIFVIIDCLSSSIDSCVLFFPFFLRSDTSCVYIFLFFFLNIRFNLLFIQWPSKLDEKNSGRNTMKNILQVYFKAVKRNRLIVWLPVFWLSASQQKQKNNNSNNNPAPFQSMRYECKRNSSRKEEKFVYVTIRFFVPLL